MMSHAFTRMMTAAASAAQSSAASHPRPPQSAMAMPTNAAPEVIASLM